jgi:uncharacterized protein
MPGGLEYLIGVTEAGRTRGRYTAFWATDRAKEKRAFEDFVRFVKDRRAKDPNLHLYHYAPYEPAAFKRLAARHNTCEEHIDELLRARVFVDLYRVVRQGLRASLEYSLKKIVALYGFSRKANLKDAGSCLVAMATWLDRKTTDEPDEALKATIAAYNEDDCASTLALRDWLEITRKELANAARWQTRRRKSLPRPTPRELGSEEQAKRVADVEMLERELTDTIPADAALRTPQQQATWLLAQLVDWHRREDKSTYWEYYRQCDLSDEELIEDAAPLGGLEHLGEVGKERNPPFTAIGSRIKTTASPSRGTSSIPPPKRARECCTS